MTKKTEEPKKSELVISKENHTFIYKFTPEEIKIKGKELARSCAEKIQIEEELKSVKSSYKYKLDGKESEINLLSNHISTGEMMITDQCQVEKDFEKGTKKYFHEGFLVSIEKLTAYDHQLQLQLKEEELEKDAENKDVIKESPITNIEPK